MRSRCEVETPVEGNVVRFSHTYISSSWRQPRVSHSTLRFLDRDSLKSFVTDAGLMIKEQFGNWDRSPVTDKSPEIITIARRA